MITLEQKISSPNGQQPASEQVAVENPATGKIIALLPVANPPAVAAAVQRARAAQPGWQAMGVAGRARLLLAFRKVAMRHKGRMIATIVAENGKPRNDALIEVLYLADTITYYCKHAAKWLADERVGLHLLKTKRALISYQPFGVVGVISPWNFPLILSAGDTIPALLAGNAVVIKPSEVTPLAAMLLVEWAREAGLPENILQVVNGYAETGTALVDNVDLIAFTGSVATGRRVAERAAQRLIPALLELGGKDPMIILKDADLERAARAAVYGGMSNAGQLCISIERVYVEAPIYDQFVAKVTEQVQKLRVGADPDGAYNVDMGPLTNANQRAIVERQVADARERGATVVTGGKRGAGAGYFYEPTILTNVSDEMLVMQEETFGPLLPIIKVADAAEAIRRANDSPFGLSSSLWTRDVAEGERLAGQIEAGSTVVNDVVVNYLIPEVPFGGVKESGIGYRHGGAESLRRYTHPHSIIVDRFGLKREAIWFPYDKLTARLLRRVMDLLYRRG